MIKKKLRFLLIDKAVSVGLVPAAGGKGLTHHAGGRGGRIHRFDPMGNNPPHRYVPISPNAAYFLDQVDFTRNIAAEGGNKAIDSIFPQLWIEFQTLKNIQQNRRGYFHSENSLNASQTN